MLKVKPSPFIGCQFAQHCLYQTLKFAGTYAWVVRLGAAYAERLEFQTVFALQAPKKKKKDKVAGAGGADVEALLVAADRAALEAALRSAMAAGKLDAAEVEAWLASGPSGAVAAGNEGSGGKEEKKKKKKTRQEEEKKKNREQKADAALVDDE